MLTTSWWCIITQPQNLKTPQLHSLSSLMPVCQCGGLKTTAAAGLYMLIRSAVLMVWLFVWPWAGGTAQRDHQCLHTNPAGAAETGTPAQAKRFHYLRMTGGGDHKGIRKELHMWLTGVPSQQFMADYIRQCNVSATHCTTTWQRNSTSDQGMQSSAGTPN